MEHQNESQENDHETKNSSIWNLFISCQVLVKVIPIQITDCWSFSWLVPWKRAANERNVELVSHSIWLPALRFKDQETDGFLCDTRSIAAPSRHLLIFSKLGAAAARHFSHLFDPEPTGGWQVPEFMFQLTFQCPVNILWKHHSKALSRLSLVQILSTVRWKGM